MNYRARKQGTKEFGHFILTFFVMVQICHKTILHFKGFEGCFALATKTTLIISASILFFKLTEFLSSVSWL